MTRSTAIMLVICALALGVAGILVGNRGPSGTSDVLASSAVSTQSQWVLAEGETVAPDGVTHLCKILVSPIMYDDEGMGQRTVTQIGLYMHDSGEYVSLARHGVVVPADSYHPVGYGAGPFEGEGWVGQGRKEVSISVNVETWGDVTSPEDLSFDFSVEPLGE